MARKSTRVGVAVATTIALLCSMAAASWAATVTQPDTSPFNVPRVDDAGSPDYFTVTASGYAPGATVFVEQCDGSDPNPAPPSTWFPNDHCDPATGNAPATANASGVVTFPANNANFRLSPFKGENPQGGLFRCLGAEDPDPDQSLPNWHACTVRVTQHLNTSNPATDAYLAIVLPSDTANLHPACTVGAGVPGGTIKIGPGVTASASAKKVTINVAGSLDDCENMSGVPSKFPISSGAMKAQVQVPPGAMCTALFSGTPIKTKLTLTWKGINPKTGKLATAAPADTTTLASVSEATANPRGLDASGAAFAGTKSAFSGKHASLHIVVDESPAQLAAACGVKGGLKRLHFTGVNGPSTLEILP